MAVLVEAVSVFAVLQELAEKGRLDVEDFRYMAGRGGKEKDKAARLLVDKDFAGFLIGKGGEKIRRLRDQTGAVLQFRGPAEEVALKLQQEQRVLDIRGRPGERDQAVRAALQEMEAAATTLLVPLAVPEALVEEAVKSAGVTMRYDITSLDERAVVLEGDAANRLAAVLALLAKADAYGSAKVAKPSAAAPAEAAPELVPKPGPERKLEPESGKVYSFEEFQKAFAAEYSEKDIEDYWRDACQAIPASPEGSGRQTQPPAAARATAAAPTAAATEVTVAPRTAAEAPATGAPASAPAATVRAPATTAPVTEAPNGIRSPAAICSGHIAEALCWKTPQSLSSTCCFQAKLFEAHWSHMATSQR